MIKTSSVVFSVLLGLTAGTVSVKAQTYSIAKTFHIQSSGGWDYIFADAASNKLYVSHGTQVNVLDKTTGDSLGVIPKTTGVHGIAVVHSTGKGYTSNGRNNSVTIFDLNTLKVIDTIAVGKNPDAIFYDDFSKKIITCNGRSNDLTVIDAATDKVVATIPVGGKPETAVSDGAGNIFINNEDKSTIEVVDITSMKHIKTWPIAPGTSPSGLCIDPETKRLFAGCDNKLLMVIDATNGKVVAQLPIGDGCDGTAFDPSLKKIYSSNGEGTLTVIKEVTKDKFEVEANIPTKAGARTISVDTKTSWIYLPTADFGKKGANDRWPPMIPGSFQVLVVQPSK
jgi:YVTN family beta-propeller protein